MELKNIGKNIKAPWNIVNYLNTTSLCKWIPDSLVVKCRYRMFMGKNLNLHDPQTFNEKLQWLKLYDRNPKYTSLVDKYEVKKIISQMIGEEYVIPTLGVWDCYEQIDFDLLPDQFVLKSTHDSHGILVCKDKEKLEHQKVKLFFDAHLRNNYFYPTREWPYKDVKPRIIAEKYMTNGENDTELSDYKFYCFNGHMECVMICYDRGSGDTKFYFFDREWNLLRINKRGKEAPEGFTLPKPKNYGKMIQLAERLSKDVAFVRVDLYNCDGDIYFGEMTFYPQSGFDPNYLPETDRYFGNLIDLSICRKRN